MPPLAHPPISSATPPHSQNGGWNDAPAVKAERRTSNAPSISNPAVIVPPVPNATQSPPPLVLRSIQGKACRFFHHSAIQNSPFPPPQAGVPPLPQPRQPPGPPPHQQRVVGTSSYVSPRLASIQVVTQVGHILKQLLHQVPLGEAFRPIRSCHATSWPHRAAIHSAAIWAICTSTQPGAVPIGLSARAIFTAQTNASLVCSFLGAWATTRLWTWTSCPTYGSSAVMRGPPPTPPNPPQGLPGAGPSATPPPCGPPPPEYREWPNLLLDLLR